ncbi:MAG: methylamine utilization protein [Gammaproteobacteria bacterium]|nr:methylamine utilization protein [Gammaproteobacteria bacterium]
MKIPPSFWLCLGLLVSPVLQAQDIGTRQLDVRVRDQAGALLQDAVVTLRPANATATTAAAGTVAIMDQRGKIFVPHVLVIQPGTRVEFPNSDHVRHHVYSFSPPKPFELRLYSGAETPFVSFDRPGVVSLGCNIHDWMQGYIYITEDPLFALSTADGIAHFANLADGSYRMHIWHPRLRGPYMGVEYALSIGTATPARLDYSVEIRSRQAVQQPPAADMDPFYGKKF